MELVKIEMKVIFVIVRKVSMVLNVKLIIVDVNQQPVGMKEHATKQPANVRVNKVGQVNFARK